jgi:hypothetical protein
LFLPGSQSGDQAVRSQIVIWSERRAATEPFLTGCQMLTAARVLWSSTPS